MRSAGVIALLVLAMGACGEGAATQTKGSESGGSFSGTSGAPPSTGGAAGSSGALGSGGSAALGSGGASGTTGSGGSRLSDGSVDSGATGGVGGALGVGGASGVGGAGGTGATAQCSSTSTLAPGETTRTIQVGGLSRTYILHVPSSYSGATPVPLVLDFHPLFGTGAIERSNSGYLALSEQYGFVIAYPDGIDNAWNIGPCCTMSRTVDDLGFARAMVEEISAQGCIDRTRVYATGYSMGGGMSYYLACNAADMFAAVAPSAFDLLIDSEEPCHPVRPITVISFRGTADPIVPYSGGASNPPNGLAVTIHFLGAVATFQKWSDLDACTDTPSTQGDCQTHSACAQGVEVTLCTAVGGGHVTGDPNIGWQTLSRHALP